MNSQKNKSTAKYRTRVEVSRFAEKQLEKLPKYIREALMTWKESVETFGISEVHKIRGYHDEPLKGERTNQRSIRLNRAYRAFYVETLAETLLTLIVIEVNKHEYQ